ncbi:PhoH family protein [Candidatus Woesearchaeota archaeon]|nr:PhoH family protein [Candidatus Woesearchaeota archaeon]
MSEDSKTNGKRTYVLDTNVFLHDPSCIRMFQEHDVIIPNPCLEESDRFKHEKGERGKSARDISRNIEKLRLQANAEGRNLGQGIVIGDGSTGTFQVYSKPVTPALGLDLQGDHGVDNTCIELTHQLRKQGLDAVLVTKDVNLRVRADALGIPTEDYKHDKKGQSIDSLFENKGCCEVFVPSMYINSVFDCRHPATTDLGAGFDSKGLYLNQAVVLKSCENSSQSALVRYAGDKRVQPLTNNGKINIVKLQAKNAEQQFALSALLDPAVRLPVLLGKAGTGKTLLALAAGVHQTINKGLFQKMIVVRPATVMDDDTLGYLPGSYDEKAMPFMAPIFDNLDVVFRDHAERDGQPGYLQYLQMGQIQLATPHYMRGRSVPQAYIIIDEAQNLTPGQVKGLATRMGEGSKVVLCGDPWQYDHRFLDEDSNGLTYLAKTVLGKDPRVTVDFLVKSERDPMVNWLADIL